MYEKVYEIMNPEQFKEYYFTVRETLWTLKTKQEFQVQIINNLINPNGSGQSMNVMRYQTYPASVDVSDVRRCENTLKHAEKTHQAVVDVKVEVEKKRALLFDAVSHRVKYHRTLELEKLDSFIENLKRTSDKATSAIDNMKHTYGQLKKNILPQEANKAEKHRLKDQRKHNDKRNRRRTIQAEVRSANKVSQILAQKNAVSLLQGQKPALVYRFVQNDMHSLNNQKLLPKFHLSGLKLLIKLEAFCDETMPAAESLVSVLEERKRQHGFRHTGAKDPKPQCIKPSNTLSAWLQYKPSESISGQMSESETDDESSFQS